MSEHRVIACPPSGVGGRTAAPADRGMWGR